MKRTLLLGLLSASMVSAASNQPRYYAHDAVVDQHGVIAPWYTGANGQLDQRARVAAETLKRYPWTPPGKAPRQLPEYMWSGAWKIAPDGSITIPPIDDWANGDLAQRAAYVLGSLIDYYRYSGEAWAIGHVSLQADMLLDYCLTPDDHPWPRFLISVPIKGKPYGQADPHGFIQLDIVAEVGIQMIRAAHLCDNERYMRAAQHWGDLLAAKRLREPGVNPWPRYANPTDAHWDDLATGSVAYILEFLDELIESGYTGENDEIIKARLDGVAYLRDVLLPNWLAHDTWGRNYWDWTNHVQAETITEYVARYLIDHPDEFPNWKNDVRNILTLFIHRTCVSSQSGGDVFSGAWAYPESSSCCGRSLWYAPFELAFVYAQYADALRSRATTSQPLAADDHEWAREMARRQLILATYDFHPTGVVEDGIEGGPVVAGDWFKIAHPMALKHSLAGIAWMPETFAPPGENHIVRSTSTVTQAFYDSDVVAFSVDRAPAGTFTLLRVARVPARVQLGSSMIHYLPRDEGLSRTAYSVKPLPAGDYLVRIRHDGQKSIRVLFDQGARVDNWLPQATKKGEWDRERDSNWNKLAGNCVRSSGTGDALEFQFEGTQFVLTGRATPDGGIAELRVDGFPQPGGIDCWGPSERASVLYRASNLPNTPHKVRIVVQGKGNPCSLGSAVRVDSLSYGIFDPKTPNTWGAGGGPTGAQRWIFGCPGREDYIDTQGNRWRPATEWVVRAKEGVDAVAHAWHAQRRRIAVEGTSDPELYRYGAHGQEFWANFTVGPGTYYARLKFAENRYTEPQKRAITILINGKEMVSALDIAATAVNQPSTQPARSGGGHLEPSPGMGRAVDLVFNNIQPVNGIIEIRFKGSFGGEATVQAIEVGPGSSPEGAKPVTVSK